MLGYVVWLVRLENKVKQNEEDIQEFKEEKKGELLEVNNKLDELNKTLTGLCINFADLSGYIRRCNEEKE
jgi:hypothetical protein